MKIDIQLPVRMLTAGEFFATEDWVHPHRTLDNYVLYLVERGHFILHEDENSMLVGPGETVILRANHTHYGEPLSSEERPQYYWMHFSFAGQVTDPETLISVNQHSFCNEYDKLSIQFHQLINESRGDCPIWPVCNYMASILLAYLCSQREAVQDIGALYKRIREYLKMYYHRNVSMEELSAQFHYSTDYLSRQFKKSTGMAVRQYIHSLRLNEAKNMLISTMYNVKEIAFRCGYTNEKFFITTFTRCEGMTPTKYRNLFSTVHQNNH